MFEEEDDILNQMTTYKSKALIDLSRATHVVEDKSYDGFCRFLDSKGETLWLVLINIEMAIEHLLKAKGSRVTLHLFKQTIQVL